MNKSIVVLKAFQALASFFLITIAAITIWKLSQLPVSIMSPEQRHAVLSQQSKADLEQYIDDCHKGIAGMEDSLSLLAKWVLSISALNLSLMVLDSWTTSRLIGKKNMGHKSPEDTLGRGGQEGR